MNKEEVFKSIVDGYRSVITTRYDYDQLILTYNPPPELDKNTVKKIRNYFLEYLYPDYEKRQMLNEAFDTLDSYIKSPKKLLNILMTSSVLLFKYGRSLPQILIVGMKALKSFRSANRFEAELVGTALSSGKLPPYSDHDIEHLISQLPKEQVQEFIIESKELFEVLYDRKLVIKIIDVSQELIERMKKKPKLYSLTEIAAIELGFEILVKGNALFEELSEKGRRAVIDMTVEIEQEALERIYSD